MLDIRLIRSEPDTVRTALARRGDVSDDAIDRVLEIDERWRGQTGVLAARGRELSDLETSIRGDLDQLLLGLPNIPAQDAPPADTVLREVGVAGREGLDHLALAGSMIDMEHGAA